MGLGKTIQAIAVIGTSKERLITNPQHSTPTIIICPPRLITNWQSEISNHAQAGALQVKIYHGPTCHSLSEADILKCDIIITSYNTITQEFKQTHTSTSFIFKIICAFCALCANWPKTPLITKSGILARTSEMVQNLKYWPFYANTLKIQVMMKSGVLGT
ncbi:hypothetical protein O181_054007 [Austropuccinia psidii MF-1]|uniref:SNF2 N-terminal domain-containing protein n=1 Tax=Austropuccinia psidii MF-1 TaxID=1389203 RepID=A0A9Q3EAU0_9BASI|nr:hypothetical protein [Austropuccinia psidii MF-1]